VFYISYSDDHVHELFFNGTWHDIDLTSGATAGIGMAMTGSGTAAKRGSGRSGPGDREMEAHS
jgi:hypothetical protein